MTRTSSGWLTSSRRWWQGPGPSGRRNPCTRHTRNPLRRPGGKVSGDGSRRRWIPQRTWGKWNSRNPRPCGCSEGPASTCKPRLRATEQVAFRTSGRPPVLGTPACVSIFAFVRVTITATKPPTGSSLGVGRTGPSLFEWALNNKREQEKAAVGPGARPKRRRGASRMCAALSPACPCVRPFLRFRRYCSPAALCAHFSLSEDSARG